MKVESAFIPHPSSLILDWLGGRDSNPDSQIQSLESYHWTTSQQEEFEFTYRTSACQPTLYYPYQIRENPWPKDLRAVLYAVHLELAGCGQQRGVGRTVF